MGHAVWNIFGILIGPTLFRKWNFFYNQRYTNNPYHGNEYPKDDLKRKKGNK